MMLGEQVGSGAVCSIRFEIPEGRKTRIVQASAIAVYCVCVGQQGFRVGFHFSAADPARTQLINAL